MKNRKTMRSFLGISSIINNHRYVLNRELNFLLALAFLADVVLWVAASVLTWDNQNNISVSANDACFRS